MPRKPTTVRIGRDSKGAYIKYGRQKIYISKSVQQRLASMGRESLTEFLVKWIVKHFTRRRRRRRDRKDRKEFDPPPKSIGTTGLPEAKVKSLPLEAQRQHLVALSLLARPPAEQQRYLEDKRQAVKQSSDAKNNRRFIEAPAPSDDEVYGKEGERFYIEGPDGKQQPVPKSLVPALMHSGQLMEKDINASRLGKLQAEQETKEEKKLRLEQELEVANAHLVNLYDIKKEDGTPLYNRVDKLKNELERIGGSGGKGYAGKISKLIERIRFLENNRDAFPEDYAAMLELPFYKAEARRMGKIAELEKQYKGLVGQVPEAKGDVKHDAGDEADDDEAISENFGAPSPEEESHRPLRRRLESDDDEPDDQRAGEAGGGGVAGTGAGLKARTEPLTDEQIDDLMSDIPGYLGTICKDEIPGLTEDATMAWNAGRPFGFITLTLTRAQATGSEFRLRPKDIATADDLGPVVKERKKGLKRPPEVGHWVAVACIPDTQQLAYYDSFGVPAPADIKVALKDMFDKIAPRTLLKFKENLIQEQSVDTDNCGWFCIQFSLDMFHGRKFTEATPYNKVLESERNIEQFKKRFKPFSWL